MADNKKHRNNFTDFTHSVQAFFNNTFNKTKKFRREESGAVMLIVACSLIVFLSITSFATDLGLVYYQKSKLQSALDAAALAAASDLPNKTAARSTAMEYIEKNGFVTDNIVVEFPSDEIVRVTETDYEVQTIFANLFNIKMVNLNAKAAAKYVNKKLAIDFDYLMFYGDDDTTFALGGAYFVNGNIFANGNLNVNGHTGSYIAGTAGTAGSGYVNKWAVSVGSLETGLVSQDMPDYDSLIMAITPTFGLSSLTVVMNHIQPTDAYSEVVPGNRSFSSGIHGSLYVGNNMSTSYGAAITINGNLYVGGDFSETADLVVNGDCYVGGSISTGWGKSITVNGNLYVEDDFEVSGPLNVTGDIYVGGSLTRGSGYAMSIDGITYIGEDLILNGQGTFKHDVYVVGNFTKGGGSGTLNINGNVCAGGVIGWSTGMKTVNGNIYAYGNNAGNGAKVITLSGPFKQTGDMYCGNGGGSYTGCILNFSGQGAYDMQGVIYSAGKITMNQGANGITLNGCIVAEDDIVIGGTTHTYNSSGATLTIYSRKGDITLTSQAGGFDLYGIIYAPFGNVELSSGGFDIYGNIIADTITCRPGGLNMQKNTRELPYMKTMKCSILVE